MTAGICWFDFTFRIFHLSPSLSDRRLKNCQLDVLNMNSCASFLFLSSSTSDFGDWSTASWNNCWNLRPSVVDQHWRITLRESRCGFARFVKEPLQAVLIHWIYVRQLDLGWQMLTVTHSRMVFQAIDVATKSRFQRKELQSDTPQDGRTFATYREKWGVCPQRQGNLQQYKWLCYMYNIVYTI